MLQIGVYKEPVKLHSLLTIKSQVYIYIFSKAQVPVHTKLKVCIENIAL